MGRIGTNGMRSASLLKEASKVIPGGVNSARRKIDPPLCISHANGAHLEDVDGRRYIDYHAAYGPIILGHSFPSVVERVSEAIQSKVSVGVGATESEVELAQKIVSHVPSVEQVVLSNSGSEATLHSIRLARAITSRQKLVKFQGSFNGVHDYTLRNILSSRDKIGERDPGSAGMLKAAIDNTLVCRFNDLHSVERAFEEYPGEIAAVILEPVAHNAPSIVPKAGFLEGLRQVCDREDALLIFDEIVTGFRHHIGGYQAISGVMPDLTAMGKAIANGFPIAAIGGKREHMERLNTTVNGDVFYGGTYNGNAVGVAAALATIEVLEAEPVYDHIFTLGHRMRDGLAAVAERLGVQVTVSGFGSIFGLCFMEGPIESYDDVIRNDAELFVRYRRELVARGILEMPENLGRSHISYSHTDADIDESLEVAEKALQAALRRSAARQVASPG